MWLSTASNAGALREEARRPPPTRRKSPLSPIHAPWS